MGQLYPSAVRYTAPVPSLQEHSTVSEEKWFLSTIVHLCKAYYVKSIAGYRILWIYENKI